MAEASPQPGRYFCHCCSVEIVPRLPDYICPRCESGFIEELPEETRSAENGAAPSTAPADQSRQQPFEGYGHFAFGIFDDSFELPTFPPGAQADDGRDTESRREREQHSRHRYGARQPRARLTARRATGRHEGVPTLEGIIQQLVNGIITPAAIPSLGLGPWGVLHSNPMDYAWGANGLDAIITQLLNQFENTGPPPADKEKIQALPTVPVTEEHVGSGLECPVCKDDYGLGERVRQLPCNHLFHDGCIVPWLEQLARQREPGQQLLSAPAGPQGEPRAAGRVGGRRGPHTPCARGRRCRRARRGRGSEDPPRQAAEGARPPQGRARHRARAASPPVGH
ncbi:E3 ubiquitin-protein ligase RNF126 isoform X2 [Hippopotamus amphibius kiboko]|uniref:E3 ubiquitin-protein ligase RNF126 isoform X2 n=1 Tax=Hippopotamus amphibius kiboko TaxID=575201 RepID=UPI002594C29F|nr:E3 ubiquitin-protein ligase RNF126 isoform X2 [Hippopotamus amphibius kiboko]